MSQEEAGHKPPIDNHKERGKPLILTLNERGQLGLLRVLKESLSRLTYEEVKGDYEGNPLFLDQVDETRKIVSTMIRHSGKQPQFGSDENGLGRSFAARGVGEIG